MAQEMNSAGEFAFAIHDANGDLRYGAYVDDRQTFMAVVAPRDHNGEHGSADVVAELGMLPSVVVRNSSLVPLIELGGTPASPEESLITIQQGDGERGLRFGFGEGMDEPLDMWSSEREE